jgi:hypothetical protein
MSARDDLATWLNAGLQEWGHDGREGDITAEELIDAALREHAHELAEQIRQESSDQWERGNQDWDTHDAADLIDPKASKEPTT